jgi:ACS family hexuronate transporter-like MFS transporter
MKRSVGCSPGFIYAYTLAQFGIGLILDRGNLRLLYGLAVAGWPLTAGLTGLARGFAALFLFRLALGIMESANWPAATKMVSLHVPDHQRAFANGLFTSGTSVAAVIAPPLILALTALTSWRSSFALIGSLGLFWLAMWLPFSRKLPAFESIAVRKSPGNPYVRVLSNRRFWGCSRSRFASIRLCTFS